jgi:Uma2 family endonuclease
MSIGTPAKRALLRGALTIRFPEQFRLSDEVFWQLCRANPMMDLERSARGELVILAPAGYDSDCRNTELIVRLYSWNDRNGRPGRVLGPSAGFTLPDTAIRGPDASWISREREATISEDDRQRFAHVCPELVAEVRSPSDRKGQLRKKMREYIANGARLGWLIDPTIQKKPVEIYRPDRSVELLERPETLSGEDVLPGLVLDLKGILFD